MDTPTATPPNASALVVGLLTGRAQAFARGERSAIRKTAVEGYVHFGHLGLEGDEQADRQAHGGVDMAVHHYPLDHHASWSVELGSATARACLMRPGAFGENICAAGLLESDVCIGDVFRLGTVLLEVSQGRQPCWKVARKLDEPKLAARIRTSGRTGWYYRVRETGCARAGDTIRLEDRPDPAWPVSRIVSLLLSGPASKAELADAARLPHLSEDWRNLARRRLASAES